MDPFFFVLVMYPLALKYLFQIRQGFAIAIYFYFYVSEIQRIRWLRFAAAGIHNGAFIYLIAEFCVNIIRKSNVSALIRPPATAFSALLIIMVLPHLMGLASGATRVSQIWTFSAPDSSGYGAMAWFVVMISVYVLGRSTKDMDLFIFGASLFVVGQFSFDAAARLYHFFLPFLMFIYSSNFTKRLIYFIVVYIIGIFLWSQTFLNPARIFV